MTLHQIIDKVANHYNLDNRSMVQKSCRYLGDNNTRCAVGMFCGTDSLSIERLIKMDALACSLEDITSLTASCGGFKEQLGFELSDVLRPEVAAAPYDFWAFLQALHDDESLWDQSRLNLMGLIRVDKLKLDFPDREAAREIHTV